MIGRFLIALGLLAAAALHVAVTGQVVVPALAVLVAAVAGVAGPRLNLNQAAQALVLVGTALLVFVLAVVDVPIDPARGGPKLQYVVASGTALLTVAARFAIREPERGEDGTWVLGLVAFYGCGRALSPLFLPLVTVFLGLAWLHRAWRSRAGRHKSPRHILVALGMTVGTTLVAGGAAVALRVAYQGANDFILARAGGGEVGFGAGAFELGSMNGMRASDEVILRVHGPAGERLRGQVYRDYGEGTWLPPGGRVQAAPAGGEPTGTVTTIEFVSSDEERLFLPADARAVAVTPSVLKVDTLGVPRPGADPPEAVRFDTTGPLRMPRAAPGPGDLHLTPEVDAAIGPLVDTWTAEADTPRARVAAIREHLEREYTYSLHYDRVPDVDPVAQFLLDSKLGHCEYFASGMALAARHAMVPARVVTGFRATETSPFGGHRIVRSRDAHAWVEVYLDGAWEEVDPSPQNSLEAGPTRRFLAGALDDAALAWDRWGPQVTVALLLVIFVGLQIRTLLRGRRPKATAAVEGWQEGPPDWLLPLLEQLAKDELVRNPAEPVEVFADRVTDAGRADAGVLLGRYAALRYGGHGDAAGLARDVGAMLAS